MANALFSPRPFQTTIMSQIRPTQVLEHGIWKILCSGFGEENNYSCHHLVNPPPPIFNELSDSNINLKELWPVVVGIKCWGKCWSGKYVLLHTDNTQVVSMIASGRSKNAQAVCLLRKLFWICVIYKIDLRAFYINTSDNVLADKLSRLSPDVQKPHFGMPVKFMFCCSQGLSSH